MDDGIAAGTVPPLFNYDAAGERREQPKQQANEGNCFVIMPFRIKELSNGREVDFEDVYVRVIKPAAEAARLTCEKCDSMPDSGLIHHKMIDGILRADIVVADITADNPNVYYELGVRHTARASGTVIICLRGTKPRFDIGGLTYFEYVIDPADPDFEQCKATITAAIGNAQYQRQTDSLVHRLVSGLNVSLRAAPLSKREIRSAVLATTAAAPKQLGVITGDLIYVEDIDVWVNPESTRMEMARVHDNSVSATIRYHSARLGIGGELIEDHVAKELTSKLRKGRREHTIAEAATVVVTRAGQLTKPNGVRYIFHLAAQHGEPTKGYVTVRSYEDCIKNVLEAADDLNRANDSAWFNRKPPLRSVIFPLFGTRNTERSAKDVATNLVRAAKTYLETWPHTGIEKVYFLAYTDADLDLCMTAFNRLGLKLEVRAQA